VPTLSQLPRVLLGHLEPLDWRGMFTTGHPLDVSETSTRRQSLADQVGTTANDVSGWRDEALLFSLARCGPLERAIFTQTRITGVDQLLDFTADEARERLGSAARILGVFAPEDLTVEGWWE
jgi:hypothetical protein